MAGTLVFYDPIYLEHDNGPGHPERPERLQAAMRVMEKTGLIDKVDVVSPRDATEREIELVHPVRHIAKVKEVAEAGGGWLDPDTHVGPRSYDAALRSAGAALEGIERILSGAADNAFCLVRPPGHHATADRGMGFCLFNNNAIASRFALEEFGISRIFIIDWDAHHGNGIQDIFYEEPRVLYISLHQFPHYPGSGNYQQVGSGKGEGYTVNFPLPAHSGEEAYLAAFDQVILPIARQYEPELVLICAGYDGHFNDPLCSMYLSAMNFAAMAERIKDLAEEVCGGKLMASLEGGYDLAGIAASIANTIAVMAGDETRLMEPEDSKPGLSSPRRGMEVVETTREYLSAYWSL